MSTAPEPITPDEAAALIERGDAVLIDVRDRAAFDAAHPAGAQNIPISHLADRLDDVRPARLVITSCGGGSRGPRAAHELTKLGVAARPLAGGLRGWRAAGLAMDETSG